MTKACSTCGTLNPDDAIFCENCGADLRQDTNSLEGSNANGKTCPNCGTQNELDTVFCTNCGFAFQSTVNMDGLQPMQQGPSQPKKSPVWPWLLGLLGVIIILGSSYAIFASKQGISNSSQKSNQQRIKKSKSTADSSREEASIIAENESLKKQSSSSEISSQSNTSSSRANNESQQKTTINLTEEQKSRITQQFLAWASPRAATGNMAVSDYYFNHGSAGLGDWYANTPDGMIQVQDNQHPGAAGFKVHAIGGVVFYTAKDGKVGIDSTLKGEMTAQGYSANMDFSQKVSKYVLGDNGVVYELALGQGVSVIPEDGFGELDDDGNKGSNGTTSTFIISKDQAAQETLTNLIRNVRGSN